MTYIFGDSFDLYATMNDLVGYWDSTTSPASWTLVAGRFTGSQAVNAANLAAAIRKSSGVNDAVHHCIIAFRQTATLTGTSAGVNIQLVETVTTQCSIVFRSDGAILLTSGGPTGATLATYTGAVTSANTWYAFEFEVVINNTTGAFRVRKNGNTSNDFDSGAVLNTRGGTANNYANYLAIGQQVAVNAQQFDDFFWQSGAATGIWLGDIRCYTRLPASDASVQFSKLPTTVNLGFAVVTTAARGANATSYTPIIATYSGTISAITVLLSTGATGHFNVAIYDSTGVSGGPVNVLATGIPITNPVSGPNVVTFVTPLSVTKGTQYVVAVDQDTSITYSATNYGGNGSWFGTTTYASFPATNPSPTLNGATAPLPSYTIALTLTRNAEVVGETQQDGLTSYVYDNTAGHADFYNLPSLGLAPTSIFAVTTRGFIEKSDAGFRSAAVQLKSGTTTVSSPTMVLNTAFGWTSRTDTVDPNTSSAWTALAVDNAQIGPIVIA